MPLLSLPSELLVDIIRETSSTTPNSYDDKLSQTPSCTPRNATSLAHTCQLLRSLALPFMYASVTAHLAVTPTLHAILTSDAHITNCVRHLTVFLSDPRGAQHLKGILKCCQRLQELRLDGEHATTDFAATLMLYMCPEPEFSLALRNFHPDEIIRYLSLAPPGLHTVRFEGPASTRPVVPISDPPTPTVLPGVRQLICDSGLFDHQAPEAGWWAPQIMPNVQILDLEVTLSTIPLLLRYAELGTCLTELTVDCEFISSLLCKAVAALAPSRRRFVSSQCSVCQTLFEADWSCVECLELVCEWGCDEAQPKATREAALRLLCARPTATVLVKVKGESDLVRWAGGTGYVAEVYVFGSLEYM